MYLNEHFEKAYVYENYSTKMTYKPNSFDYQIIQSNIDLLYMRMELTLNNILRLVEQENDFKGFYNPKKHKIINCDDVNEFNKFHSTIRGLNNYIYYNSLILSSYSVFEHSLKQICQFIDSHFELQEKYVDELRNILDNCVNYIKSTKLVDFNNKEIEKIYTRLKKVNKLRNLVAHYNGNLIKDKSKPLEKQTNYNLFKSDKRLVIIGNGQVYIDNDTYIQSFVEDSKKFLNLLIKNTKNNC